MTYCLLLFVVTVGVGTAYAFSAQGFRIVGVARREFTTLYEEHLDAEQNHRHKDQQNGEKDCFHCLLLGFTVQI